MTLGFDDSSSGNGEQTTPISLPSHNETSSICTFDVPSDLTHFVQMPTRAVLALSLSFPWATKRLCVSLLLQSQVLQFLRLHLRLHM